MQKAIFCYYLTMMEKVVIITSMTVIDKFSITEGECYEIYRHCT
jgi:hypothetical protein